MLDGIDNLIEVSINLRQNFKQYKKYQVMHEDRVHGDKQRLNDAANYSMVARRKPQQTFVFRILYAVN